MHRMGGRRMRGVYWRNGCVEEADIRAADWAKELETGMPAIREKDIAGKKYMIVTGLSDTAVIYGSNNGDIRPLTEEEAKMLKENAEAVKEAVIDLGKLY